MSIRNSNVWTPQMDARLKKLRALGMTWAEIDEAFGLRDQACRRYSRIKDPNEKRLPSRQLKWTKEEDNKLRDLVANHSTSSFGQLAENTFPGRSRESVIGRADRLGLKKRPYVAPKKKNKPFTPGRCNKPFTPKSNPLKPKLIYDFFDAQGERIEPAKIIAQPAPLDAIPIEKTTRISCKWIYDNKLYCGKEIKKGSYCKKHAEIAYIKPVKRTA